MTIINHELRQSRLSLTVWTAAIGFLIAVVWTWKGWLLLPLLLAALLYLY